MTVVLSNGIRKNGATRICFPRTPHLAETLPRLASAPCACLSSETFNRPWMRRRSVEMAVALWAGCPSDTEAHQLACQVILGVQSKAIEVVESA